METQIKTQVKSVLKAQLRRNLVEEFIQKSELTESETLKVDQQLFMEAVNQDNVQFEFIQLDSLQLAKESLQISNAKNALVEAEYGIAETGCLVFDFHDQDLFLTLCLAETLEIVLPASNILSSVADLELIKGVDESELKEQKKFVSGTSRKADVDRFGPQNKRTLVYVIEDL